MRVGGSSLGPTVCAIALCSLSPMASASAAAVLRAADVTITVREPASCDVSMVLLIEGATSVDHRIESPDGTTIDQLHVDGAEQAAAPRTVGRTQSLTVTPRPAPYTIRYRVQEPPDRATRCPLWLPTTPTDGVSRVVRLQVELPADTTPGSTMPRFKWMGARGNVTLAHLPAFVLIPFAAPGQSPGWDVSAAMDAAAVSVFVGASAIWLWRRRAEQVR
jgi:hypothetical protein